MEAEHTFEHGHDGADVGATSTPEYESEQCPDGADHEALGEKDADDPARRMPSVRRIAMSERFSLTTITSAATMLNAATATTSIRIRLIIVFSMRIARKYAECSFAPVLDLQSPPPTAWRRSAARAGALHHVVEADAQPGGWLGSTGQVSRIGDRHERQRSIVILQPDFEDPGDGEGLQQWPATRCEHVAAGHHHGEFVTDFGADLPREHATDDHAARARLEVAELALQQVLLDRRHVRFRRRIDAVQQRRFEHAGTAEHRLHVHEWRDALHARHGSNAVGDRLPVRQPLGRARHVACAVSETRRLRSSPSKPFMTEMMVISAATPRHTPAIEIQEMNETKKPCLRVRT